MEWNYSEISAAQCRSGHGFSGLILMDLQVSGLLSFSIYEQVIVWTEKPRIQTETLQTRNVVQGL